MLGSRFAAAPAARGWLSSPRESYNPEKENFMRDRGSYQNEAAHPARSCPPSRMRCPVLLSLLRWQGAPGTAQSACSYILQVCTASHMPTRVARAAVNERSFGGQRRLCWRAFDASQAPECERYRSGLARMLEHAGAGRRVSKPSILAERMCHLKPDRASQPSR